MKHVIVAGEAIETLMVDYGLGLDVIWDAPENAALRAERPNPHQLVPGDTVFIPDKREKQVTVATGASHRFVRKGVPTRFRMRFLDEDEQPRARVEYQLEVDGKKHEGNTDGDGWVERWIPNKAQRARLTLADTGEIHLFQLGHLDPASSESGARARLVALGFLADDAADYQYRSALSAFQRESERPVTGVLDDATREALVKRYGS